MIDGRERAAEPDVGIEIAVRSPAGDDYARHRGLLLPSNRCK
jgi:hypothetical protein